MSIVDSSPDAGKNDHPCCELNNWARTAATEPDRIRRIYAEREEPGEGPLDVFRLMVRHGLQQQLLLFFRAAGVTSLDTLRILDVGCGSGGNLRRLSDFGALPENCFGIDLLSQSLRGARRLSPNICFAEANAAQLPFANEVFDLVFQFTVLTSVLDSDLRACIVREIWRVLRPGGYFILYDFAYSNPANPNVRGIGRKELTQLLQGFRVRFHRLTLAPPLGRRAARISPFLYRVLAAIPLLRTHYLCFALKP